MECPNLEGQIDKARKAGWRLLILAHHPDPREAAEYLAGLAQGDCLHVAPGEYRGVGCRLEKSPMDIEEYLGTEHRAAIVSTPGLLRPTVIASAGETVVAGGFLAIAAPPWEEWNPGPLGGTGAYKEYLERVIPEAKTHVWIDLDSCRVRSLRWDPPPYTHVYRALGRAPPGVPRAIYELARTPSQGRGLEEAARLLRGRDRTLLIVGNRGRGKSFLAGLILALAVSTHAIGRAVVTGPSLSQVQTVFRGLLAGLEATRVLERRGVKVRESQGRVTRVTGPWFRVSYEAPHRAKGAPLVVVDEAAALGIARVRRITWESGRSILATTVHGYEGSGRTMVHLLDKVAPKPLRRVELVEPIRYQPGDPLEEWLYKAFILDPEPEGPRDPGGRLDYRVHGHRELAGDPGLLRRLYSILALAHYRNTPDDLLAMLESPHVSVHSLESPSGPVAVALVAWEDWEAPEEQRLALSKLALYAPRARSLEAARVSRIAVLPWLQRRGLGSRLLSHIEEWTRGRGAGVLATMFSRHEVAGFWAVNGFLYYYMSPRYNRVTGEKNLACAKPLTSEAEPVVHEASGEFRARLLHSSHSIYRDVAAETLALIIRATAPAPGPECRLTPSMEARLEACARGELDPEQAMDALHLAWQGILAAESPPEGSRSVYLVARLVQGKPHEESLRIAGLGEDEAAGLLAWACRRAWEWASRRRSKA